MTKEEKETLQILTEQANKILAETRAAVALKFTAAVVTQPNYVTQLARALSQRFPTMRFLVAYDGGGESVFAEPLAQKVDVDARGTYEQCKERVDLATLAPERKWPAFEIVKAYAEGHGEGSRGRADLERKLDEAERRLERAERHPIPPWAFGPFGFRG